MELNYHAAKKLVIVKDAKQANEYLAHLPCNFTIYHRYSLAKDDCNGIVRVVWKSNDAPLADQYYTVWFNSLEILHGSNLDKEDVSKLITRLLNTSPIFDN